MSLSQPPHNTANALENNNSGFFQGIQKVIDVLCGRIRTIFTRRSQAEAVLTTLPSSCPNRFKMQELKVHPGVPGFSSPNQTPKIPENSGSKATTATQCQLPQVGYSKVKNSLIASNPELATWASASWQNPVLTLSWPRPPANYRFDKPNYRTAKHFHQKNRARSLFISKTTKLPDPHLALKSLVKSQPRTLVDFEKIRVELTSLHPHLTHKSPAKSQPWTVGNFGKIREELTSSHPSFALIPTKQMHPPETFSPFKKLPVELQIMIWHHAMDEIGMRIVSLLPGRYDIPGVIHACRASRYEARKKFLFCIGQHGFTRLYRFLDVEKDILYVQDHRLSTMLLDIMTSAEGVSVLENRLSHVTRLALDVTAVAQMYTRDITTAQYLWRVLPAVFPNLRHLFIVLTAAESVRIGKDVGGYVGPISNKKQLWLRVISSSTISRVFFTSRYGSLIHHMIYSKDWLKKTGFCEKVEMLFAIMPEN